MLKTVRVPDQFAPIFEKAQEYVAEFFSQRKDLPEQGTIEIFGQRYILVRASPMSVEFFEMVQKLYADKGEEEALGVARSLLFDIAHTMAIADARSFAERMHVTDPISKLSAGPIQFAHAGFAFVDISAESRPTPDEDFYLLYDHPFSFESDSWLAAGKTTDFPVCVMNAGYASGWCEHSFGVPLVATEILCRAKGDDHCRFIMAHPTRIEGFIADYLRAQPGLAKHVTRYEIPGFFSRKKIEDELAAREEQYRGIFEASTNTLIIVDDAGAIVHANPAASLLFGYATDELRGMELGRLVLDRQVAVHHADPTGAGHGDGQRPFGDGVHGRRQDRHVEGDAGYQRAGRRHLVGQHVAGRGDQQHVVEGEAGDRETVGSRAFGGGPVRGGAVWRVEGHLLRLRGVVSSPQATWTARPPHSRRPHVS